MLRIAALFMVALVPMAWCACNFIPRSTFDQDSDDMSCKHPDYQGVTISLGGNYLTPDCYNVTCDASGLTSCGFGWALVGVMGLPDDCEKEKVGQCGVRFVKSDDSNTPCFEGAQSIFNEIDAPM